MSLQVNAATTICTTMRPARSFGSGLRWATHPSVPPQVRLFAATLAHITGTVSHRILRPSTTESRIRSTDYSISATTGSVSASSRIDAS